MLASTNENTVFVSYPHSNVRNLCICLAVELKYQQCFSRILQQQYKSNLIKQEIYRTGNKNIPFGQSEILKLTHRGFTYCFPFLHFCENFFNFLSFWFMWFCRKQMPYLQRNIYIFLLCQQINTSCSYNSHWNVITVYADTIVNG